MTELVNMAIQFKPLYALMKTMAKRQIKQTAEARGVGWDANIAELQSQMQVRKSPDLQSHNISLRNHVLVCHTYHVLPVNLLCRIQHTCG